MRFLSKEHRVFFQTFDLKTGMFLSDSQNRVKLDTGGRKADAERILARLTCLSIREVAKSSSGQISWEACLAINGVPWCMAFGSGLSPLKYENVDERELISCLGVGIDGLKLVANEYLRVSGKGLDLIVNRLFPSSPEFQLIAQNQQTVSFDGLVAARKIVRDREKFEPVVKKGSVSTEPF
jgi:hypothetical protein